MALTTTNKRRSRLLSTCLPTLAPTPETLLRRIVYAEAACVGRDLVLPFPFPTPSPRLCQSTFSLPHACPTPVVEN